ncbi:MAG: ABC transporter permease subunit [Pseudomonadota bacterium]
MIRLVLVRLAGAVPTLAVIVTLSFFLMRLAPGGPFDRERQLEPAVMENLRQTFLLDRPLWEQYLHYLGNLAAGDMGPSFIYRDFRVQELIMAGLPASAALGAMALALAFALGLALGAVAAMYRGGAVDTAVTAVATFGITVPTFVTAPVLSLVFGVWLEWLPAGGWEGASPAHVLLPVLTLALPQVAVIARLVRAGMIEALRSDSVRTARAYGLSVWRIVVARALRQACLPAVSYLGPAAAALMTGSIVVETIFGIPGIGRYFVQGALNRDYTLVMGTVIVVAVFVVLFNLIVDLLYAALDPRVRHG